MLYHLLAVLALMFMCTGWYFAFRETHRLFDRERELQSTPTRDVGLIDLLALFVTVVPPLGFLSIVSSRGSYASLENRIVLSTILVIVFIAMWWKGVRMLTTLGIRDWRRRFVWLAFVLPSLLVGGGLAIGLFLVSIAWVLELKISLSRALALLLNGALGLLVFLGNCWVLRGAKGGESDDQP